jgi:hypothetical protein
VGSIPIHPRQICTPMTAKLTATAAHSTCSTGKRGWSCSYGGLAIRGPAQAYYRRSAGPDSPPRVRVCGAGSSSVDGERELVHRLRDEFVCQAAIADDEPLSPLALADSKLVKI